MARTEEQKLERWTREAQTRIYRDQQRLIEAKFGKSAAEDANYGWGVSGSDGFVSVATKVYGRGVLVSEATRGVRVVEHAWRMPEHTFGFIMGDTIDGVQTFLSLYKTARIGIALYVRVLAQDHPSHEQADSLLVALDGKMVWFNKDSLQPCL